MSQLDSDLRNHGMNGEYIPLGAEGKSMSSCKLLTDWSGPGAQFAVGRCFYTAALCA